MTVTAAPVTLVDLLRAGLGLIPKSKPVRRRYVAKTGSDTADGLSEKTAYATPARALTDATGMPAGTTLVVQLGVGTYDLNVDVPSSVTLQGPPTGAKPILRADVDGAVLRIGGGMGRVRDVRLQRLAVISGRRDPAGTVGGGAALRAADRVTIAECDFQANEGYRGGGIAVVGCTDVNIADCRVEGNSAGNRQTALTGAKIGVGTITYPIGDGHGGGVYVQDSTRVEIRRCTVAGNSAVLFGGGIAVVNTSVDGGWSTVIADNDIYGNETAHGDLAVLAAPPSAYIRTPMTDLVVEQLEQGLDLWQATKATNVLQGAGWESGMGGGVGLKFAGRGVRITGNRIGCTASTPVQPNAARRGGGISCFTGSYPEISANEIAYNLAGDDGGGIAVDLFDPFLPHGETSSTGVVEGPALTRLWITLSDNDVHDNRAGSDGGGLYATGGARLAVKRVRGTASFRNNRAQENGGGLRVSYATQLSVVDVAFDGNTANLRALLPNQDPEQLLNGGGAVAARNASVTLERCSFTGNSVERFAGGAVNFVSCFEGGFGVFGFKGNEYHWFDRIMESAHNFHTRVLRITDCTGHDNRATGTSGAGGFLYVVRTTDKGGKEALWTVLSGAATQIGSNVSDHGSGTTFPRKRGNLVIELSGRSSGGVPEDRVFVSGDIPAAGIAPSQATAAATPPGPAGSRRLVVLRDATPAHDLADPALEYVHGPRPTLAAVSPAVIAVRGGTTVTLTGSGFDPSAVVTVGGWRAEILSVSGAALQITSPALPPGNADVTVTLGSGPAETVAGALRAMPDPVITAVTPHVGTVGTPVTLNGTDFPPEAVVAVVPADEPFSDPVPVPVLSRTGETEIRVAMPLLPSGAVRVGLSVTSPSGQRALRSAAFTYLVLR